MLTFLFLVSLTATTLLLLAIAGEEVARTFRVFLAQANSQPELGNATAEAGALQEPGARPSHESAELRQFPQRARVQARGEKPAEQLDRVPDRAA